MTDETTPEQLPAPPPKPGFIGSHIPGLSAQEQQFVLLYSSGLTAAAAARGAGAPSSAATFMARPHVQQAIQDLKTRIQETVTFGVAEAHEMLMEAWSNAATSTEQRQVVEALMKLHKLGVEGDKGKGATKTINVNVNRLDQMSDKDLLKLAGKSMDHLLPSAGPDD